MLDIRLLRFVAPLAEQEIGPLTTVVLVLNAGDEDATITGTVRIYRDSTGLLEYDSVLATTSLPHGTTAVIPVLTPFDPGAPADDDYFVIAEIHAKSQIPPGWHELDDHLDPMYFDVKPAPMGPPPATHHTTHEAGGMDPVDLTGMTGLTATPQTPALHAVSHQDGEADEVNVAGLHGELADDQPPLTHNFRKHTGTFWETDFLNTAGTTLNPPWLGTAVASGTTTAVAGTALHPGGIRFVSSTSSDSGHRYTITSNSILLAGYETSDIWFRPQTLAGTTIRAGFHDALTLTAPVDGCYVHMDPATGRLTGRTMSNSVGSTTGTDYQLITNTWYLVRVTLNADATRVDYFLWDDAGNLLWTDNLTTNIPTAAGRETGHGIVATNSGTTAVPLVDVDFLSLFIPDRRPDV